MLRTLGAAVLLLPFLLIPPLSASADQGGAFVVPAPAAAPRHGFRARPWGVLPVRSEDQAGASRLLFPFAHAVPFTTTRNGDVVVLQFRSTVMIGGNPLLPHNVTGFAGGPGRAEVTVAPGREIHTYMMGATAVLEITDAAQAAGSAPAAGAPTAKGAPSPALTAANAPPAKAAPPPPPVALSTSPPPGPLKLPPAAAQPPAPASPLAPPGPMTAAREPVQAAPLAPADGSAAPAAAAAAPAAQTAASPGASPAPDGAQSGPVALMVTRATLPSGTPGAAITVPFDGEVGLAAYRRGATATIVFDQRKPLDVAGLRGDASFAGLEVQELFAATVLRFTMPPDAELRPTRVASGWRIWVGSPAAVQLAPIGTTVDGARMVFAAGTPGAVVVVPDAVTGSNLLVGTQATPGQSIPVMRHAAEFTLLQTWQGVVVDPLSDRLGLRATDAGFVLSSGSPAGGLALSAAGPADAALANAAALTRRFDFVALPRTMLLRRLQSATVAAAEQPPLARLKPRLEAAQNMIALGLAAEAQALLQLAVQDDPRAVQDPAVGGLTAIAALLAGRVADSVPIEDPALGGSDEMRLWRAARAATLEEGSPAAAAQFAATLPLLLAYPEALRARLLPLAAETMVLGDQTAAAATLLASRKDDASLGLARAMLLAAKGDTAGALAAYDVLGSSDDQLVAVRARLRAVELRLASGEIRPAVAAQAEERMLYAWRGDERERALRLRVAELHVGAGEWRQALSLLRDSDKLFGPADPRFGATLRDTFARLIRDNTAEQLAPVELVELAQENADLLPDGPAGEAMVARLADKLEALDLPRQADPVLERLVRAAAAPAAKGEMGDRLASLRLENGDAAGVLAALSSSAVPGLSAGLTERRTLVGAAATLALGKPADAMTILAPLTSTAADEARATIAEKIPDWPTAETVMLRVVSATVPPDGALTQAQQQAVLRLTGDTAQAGDEAGLTSLRTRFFNRITDKAALELFRTLTAGPVRGLADLARSRRELTADQGLPAALSAMGAGK